MTRAEGAGPEGQRWLRLVAGPERVGPASGLDVDGWVARVVRGRKMRTRHGLYDEFAAALQFPWYFGENADAFDECIADLDGWLPTRLGYVVVVTEPELVLDGAQPDDLAWLVGSLTDARRALGRSTRTKDGGAGHRGPLGFQVVLSARDDTAPAAAQRWRAAGAPIAGIEHVRR